VSEVLYSVSGSWASSNFSFTLRLFAADVKDRLARSGSWAIVDDTGLDTIVGRLKRSGSWTFQKTGNEGALYFHRPGGGPSTYRMVFDDVPSDYQHGPFCSSSVGPGNIAVTPNSMAMLDWEVDGPGCA
jgi:hypothetical protein